MISKYCGLLLGLIVVAGTGVGCSGHSEATEETKLSSANETNYLDMIPPEMKGDPEKRRFFESLQPEIQRNAAVDQSLKAALTNSADPKLQAWQEFLTHWPLAKQEYGFAWHQDLQKFQGNASATTLIEDHYVFQCILNFDASKDCREVTFTKLRFSFEEVEEVQVQPGGACDVTFNTQSGKWLDLKDWEKLKASNWDFSKIGITVVSNAPIPNIKQAFK